MGHNEDVLVDLSSMMMKVTFWDFSVVKDVFDSSSLLLESK